MRRIDVDSWKRKEHFQYFSSIDDPFWTVTTELDCTETLTQSRESGASFFLSYLHKTLKAINEVEEFHLRLEGDQPVLHDVIHASATILRSDETFGCSFMEFLPDFAEFSKNAGIEMENVRERRGMCLENDYRLDLVHVSSIPWFSFTGLINPRSLKDQDGVPKLTFGKYKQQGTRYLMPLSVQVHHALIDGIHMAKMLERLQEYL